MTTSPASKSRNSNLFSAIATFFSGEAFRYILKRVLQALPTLLLASALCFFIVQAAPGDFLDSLRQNPQISKDTVDTLEKQFGLDRPIYVQYFLWLKQIITQGDFGTSFAYRRSVTSLILERTFATLLLAIASLVLTWAIAIPMGIVAAVNHNKLIDRIFQIFSYIGQGLPTLITGLLLIYFAQLTSPLFPVGGMTSIDHEDLTGLGKVLDIGWHMILPTIVLSITSFAGLQRFMRGELLDVLRQDYVRTARAKGLPENRVIYVHALRNAINPIVTLLGFEFASLLGGAFITETYFNWPGLGKLTLQAVQSLDLYLIMASLMLGALLLIVGNLLSDLLLNVVDPRIKLTDMD